MSYQSSSNSVTLRCLLGAMCYVQLLHSQTAADVDKMNSYFKRAEAECAKEQWQLCKADLVKAASIEPKNPVIHFDLAVAYSHTGQPAAASNELEKAESLGLPPRLRADAASLLKALGKASPSAKAAVPNKQPKEVHANSQDGELIHALNESIQQGAVFTYSLKPGGFTLETSTGKLWWTESKEDDGCSNGDASTFVYSVPLDRLKTTVSEGSNKDRTFTVRLDCSGNADCVTVWRNSEYSCYYRGDHRKWRLGSNDYPELIDVLEKNSPDYENSNELRFSKTDDHLIFLMVNDDSARSKLGSNLSELIRAHGGEDPDAAARTHRICFDQVTNETQEQKCNFARGDRPLKCHTSTSGFIYACLSSKVWANQSMRDQFLNYCVEDHDDGDLSQLNPRSPKCFGYYDSGGDDWGCGFDIGTGVPFIFIPDFEFVSPTLVALRESQTARSEFSEDAHIIGANVRGSYDEIADKRIAACRSKP